MLNQFNKVCSGPGREAVILKLLCDNVNSVVDKEYIQEKVWGKVFVSETSLTKAVSNLRKSLAKFDNLACEIKTISKEGYVLILDENNTDIQINDEKNIFKIKSIEQKNKNLNNYNIISTFIEGTETIQENLSIKHVYFFLVCLFSSLLASMFTAVAIVTINKIF
ncbi:transcriptional regulator domain-containing protein [Shewanella baltica OS183]|uniref:winged helix-turn-helix domain-containing protein n=1 Tax=Shewanella baltica TaxID=62322 RepID=UPI0001E0BFB0|nr:helix-turn-helix domain-containing protein [Shewanella baltica]EHQ13117.1 transcriptional regulator domain-containing protein [Shewanella baltica OS183]